jgi:PIN domain nuclease of toxin-antitoxin system
LRLLLDTHIWLWSVGERAKLGRRVARELEKPANEFWLSPLSIWEALLLREKETIAINEPFDDWVRRSIATASLREAPLTQEVAVGARNVKLPHRDPVDRLLAATAMVFELTLVTADQRLMSVEGLSVLANR